MKKLLAIITIVAVSAGSSFAACGKKVTDEGKLTSFNAEKKELTITTADGKTVTRMLTPSTTGGDKAADLVGKAVKVVSEHNKADSVTGA
jgi:hypothetical protein